MDVGEVEDVPATTRSREVLNGCGLMIVHQVQLNQPVRKDRWARSSNDRQIGPRLAFGTAPYTYSCLPRPQATLLIPFTALSKAFLL